MICEARGGYDQHELPTAEDVRGILNLTRSPRRHEAGYAPVSAYAAWIAETTRRLRTVCHAW